ncbi:hypothetical protein [Bacillus sp. FJAT-27251]|uniref:hypothetical protein n=1 Tax=Bacillus sp. FJAT-27251 TaxID=1684142 RepID=UPI0006A7F02F|nr:hypothetical protein [Bacillus sp. FJAT-27251]
MSVNIYQIHIQTNSLDEVKASLADWLSHTHKEETVIYENQDSAIQFFHNKIPSLFAVSTINEKWISILHDAYEPPFDLANTLSASFECTVIQLMGQSTVDTYSLSVHEKGSIIRKMTYGEESIGLEQEGDPFPFEPSLWQEDEEHHFFDYEDMNNFCSHFGIEILTDPSEKDGEWTIIKVRK